MADGYITADQRDGLFERIGSLLGNAQTVWLFCHENPDGDTVGCNSAVYEALQRMGKQVRMFSPDPMPRMYEDLPHAREFEHVSELPRQLPDIVMANDNGAFDRLGRAYCEQLTAMGIGPDATERAEGCVMINMDHHLGNQCYGDVNLVDPSFGACGELFYRFFRHLGWEVSLEMAINLYATIITDTGRFSDGNTKHETFVIAGELIEIGVDPFDVYNRVYNTRTPGQMRLLAMILNTMTANDELGYFYCYVTQQMVRETGTLLSDTEGATDILKTVAGYDATYFLKEEENGNVKVSARSNQGFDVRAVARRFGGGGHTAASGFRIHAGIDEAPAILERELRLHMEEMRLGSGD